VTAAARVLVPGVVLALVAGSAVVTPPAFADGGTPLAGFAPIAQAGPGDQPLEAAGRAAEDLSFVGVLEVRWTDGSREHSDTMLVQGGNGAVVVKGGTSVMASAQQRLVAHAGGPWDLLWPQTPGTQGRPSPAAKYQLTTLAAPGPTIGSRSSRVVEVRYQGALLERLYLDADTSLLLRREQFEGGTTPARTVQFDTLTIGGGATAPQPPDSVLDASPKALPAGHVPAGVSAPAALGDGYQRVGVYGRSGGVVQALYSDGLYDLSVFTQAGRLDRRHLPSATSRVVVDGSAGWQYAWPGGHIVLWEAGGQVHTAVSDAPLDQVMTSIRSLPRVSRSESLLQRLREVCRALVQPLSA
jgi:hypothetical protein